ncbi:Protein glass [Dirofilaria immitis]|nr:Protein glass [Dirofilaria immitis]
MPQITEPLDLSKWNKKQGEQLSVMEVDEEQTEVLNLSIPKFNIKEVAEQCNISIQKSEYQPTKLNKVMNDEQREPSNLPIQEADEEEKKKTKRVEFPVCTLQEHMRTHSGMKHYNCPKCQKNFTRKWNFKRHIQFHDGVKPYNCPQCKRNFALKFTLTTHIRTHTGEKPYNCSECRKSFSQSTNLKTHMRIHNSEKP